MNVVNRDRLEASRELVSFLSKCCDLMNLQMESVGKTLGNTVSEIMEDIKNLSMATEKARQDAEEAMSRTFLEPSHETQTFVDSIQSYADDLISGKEVSEDVSGLVRKNITRFGGRYNKHMQAISNLDDNVKDILVVMMAALSVDDRVAQRLQHLHHCVQAFKMFLSYLLLDYEDRLRPEVVDLLIKDLEGFTWKIYSTNEEREIHCELFGQSFGRQVPVASNHSEKDGENADISAEESGKSDKAS